MRNLEDLINFKVKTVADTMEASNKREAFNQMTSEQDQVSVSTLKQICDPLLAGRHYPQLLQKRGVYPSTYEIPENLKVQPRNYNLFDEY